MNGKIKPKLKIDFVDFNGLNKADNWFTRILSREFTVEINDRPDLLVFQEGGHLNRLYTCRKLFWTGESIMPDFRHTDYAMTCHFIDSDRHLRHPYYVWGSGCKAHDLIRQPGEAERVVAEKRKFCSFVVSNGNRRRTQERIRFFLKLHSRRPVDSGGRFMNNIGHPLPPGGYAKHDFLKQYRFNLCYENKSIPGYTTEKLVEAMWARCIPIYWGNPRLVDDFNPAAMLRREDFQSDDEFIDRIIEVYENPDLQLEILSQPNFHDNTPSKYYDDDRILGFFQRIVDDTTPPVSRRRKFWRLGRWRLAKRMHY